MASRALAADLVVGSAVRPQVPGLRCLFGTVVKIEADAPMPGWTTVWIRGYDRYDRQATGFFQYRPDAKVTVPS